ncbi:MAG: hypothetical protein JWM80_4291 [Cyanobacteria bacterium RYN_339]|nr:hypothetical protein [Cyanobacteria bacterium RYN_339]
MKKLVLLGLGLAIAACDAGRVVTPPKRTSAPTTVAAASATPAAGPTVAASPVASGPATLRKPDGQFTTLSGTITVDPTYMVATGAGKIVASGAGNIVASGAGNIVASGAGNIISGNGSAAIARSRRVLATEDGALPASGMEISVLDLASDEPLALGKDPAGQDVYTVLSDAAGGYEVYLPPEVASNVLVVARVTGKDDPRLAYDVATTPGAKVTLDEDSALLTRFIRQTYASAMQTVLKRLLDPKPGATKDLMVTFGGTGLPAAQVEAVFGPILDGIRVSLQARGITADGVPDEAERQADALLAKIKLNEIKVAPHYGVDATEFAYPNLIKALSGARAEVQAKLATQPGPTFFADVAIFKDNDVTIRKATDVMEFIVTRDFPDPKLFNGSEPETILKAVGLDATRAAALMKLARAGGSGISLAITNTFLDADTLDALAKKVKVPPRTPTASISHLKPAKTSKPATTVSAPSKPASSTPASSKPAP